MKPVDFQIPSDLVGVRAEALRRWKTNGWPDSREESWRFTRLNDLQKLEFANTDRGVVANTSSIDKTPNGMSDECIVLKFHNGILDQATLRKLPIGVSASQLDANENLLVDVEKISPTAHPISNLSLAMMNSGLHLEIAGKIDNPLMLLFSGDDPNTSAHPVVSIRLQERASATLTEWHQSDVGLSAPLVTIDIADNGQLDYAKVQHDSSRSTHLSATGIRLANRSVFNGNQISVGSRLTRLETHVNLDGEKIDCNLSAIYLGRREQHHDITTNMVHSKGHCNSNQIIRGVLDDDAHGVFQGKVHVAPDAQKTDGNQMSRALLLSRKAEANAKPELEIFADDVICAHGATVGELDDNQLFYMTSRGIKPEVARAMLINAFLNDVIDCISNDHISAVLRPVVKNWMISGGD